MFNNKCAVLFVVVYLLFLIGKSLAQTELTPNEILQKVDDIRNPGFTYRVEALVTSYKPNHLTHNSVYEVFNKGHEKTVVRILEPKAERGICLLMNGKDFQAFFPQVSKPIHLSLQERLTGEVANGDIVRTSFSDDYDAKLIGHENIDSKTYDKLELTPKNKNASYGKILLWVAIDNFWPFKAEFYTISGRFIKICLFEDYKMIGGQMRPSRLVLKDGVSNDHYSVMDYKDIQKIDIPDSFFTKENLMQLKNPRL
ncbi:MAG: outer membrane lipoprotein-sorting protein [Candidatus Omnitrophica bacterium]|nr:outer membrane lipoprotein-sorting protein [Candidatus Omnitrophota bacterium]